MVRMDAPRASLSREMCAFLKGVGCIVVSSLAVYLLLSGLSTTGAEVVGYFASVGYGVATWEIEFVPSVDAEQKPDATRSRASRCASRCPTRRRPATRGAGVQPRIVMTADALIDAYATPLGSGRQLRGGHGGGHGGGGRGHAGGARGTAHAARAHNGGVFVSRLAVGRRHMGRMVIFMVLAGRHAHQRYVWSSSAEKYLVELEPICWDGPSALVTVNITAVDPGALDSLDQAFLDVSAVLPPEE